MSEQTEFALVDPVIMGLNIFKPLPRKGRAAARKQMFEVRTEHQGRMLEIVGAYTLGADDLSILLAILALSGLYGDKMEAKDSRTARVQIMDGLETEGEPSKKLHLRITTTTYALCREAGIAINKNAYDRVAQSLKRLRAVHYNDLGRIGDNARSLTATAKQNLLSATAREDTKELTVVINALFTEIIMGSHWIKVDLRESRVLGEMARLLHLKLSILLRVGGERQVNLDTMVRWVYGPDEKDAPSEPMAGRGVRQRHRRAEVRQGLLEIAGLRNWRVVPARNGIAFVVERVKPDRPPQAPPFRDGARAPADHVVRAA